MMSFFGLKVFNWPLLFVLFMWLWITLGYRVYACVCEFICVYVTKMLILPTTAGQIYTFTMCVTHTHTHAEKQTRANSNCVNNWPQDCSTPHSFQSVYRIFTQLPYFVLPSLGTKTKNGGPAKNMHHRQYAKWLAQCSPSLFAIVSYMFVWVRPSACLFVGI